MDQDKNKKDINQDDIFKNFINEETKKSQNFNVEKYSQEVNMDTYKESMLQNREYISLDLSSLPSGQFYNPNTRISIRAASVGEVQEYSVIDDSNIIDVTEKMNVLLSRCTRVMLGNQKGSYKDIKDSDRLSLIFMIRELTFQKGNNLAKDVECKACNNEFKIEFRATNSEHMERTFIHHEIMEDVMEFYNPVSKTIDIEIGEKVWRLAPPTIGLQEIFYNYMRKSAQEKEKTPNVSFMKVFPYTLFDRNTITDKGIEEKEKEYKNLDMETFQTLNYIVDNMKLGIKGLKSKCPVCHEEVHTEMSFPGGASSLFVVSNPLAKFKKK